MSKSDKSVKGQAEKLIKEALGKKASGTPGEQVYLAIINDNYESLGLVGPFGPGEEAAYVDRFGGQFEGEIAFIPVKLLDKEVVFKDIMRDYGDGDEDEED